MTRNEVVLLFLGLCVSVWALGSALDRDARATALQNRPYAIIEASNREPMALTRDEREWVEGLLDARDRVAIDGGRMPAEYADSEAVLERLNKIGQRVGIEPCP